MIITVYQELTHLQKAAVPFKNFFSAVYLLHTLYAHSQHVITTIPATMAAPRCKLQYLAHKHQPQCALNDRLCWLPNLPHTA